MNNELIGQLETLKENAEEIEYYTDAEWLGNAITALQEQTMTVNTQGESQVEIERLQARIAELEEKLKTAEHWDVIESQRNEELQARIDELEGWIK